MRFNFLKLLDRMIVVYFPEAVRDNVVFNDVLQFSSLGWSEHDYVITIYVVM